MAGRCLTEPAARTVDRTATRITIMALRIPTLSPRNTRAGGPTRKAAYPAVATKLARLAACRGSSPAAESATGKPSEAPIP